VDDSIQSRIARATVTVVKDEASDSKGRGFLVHGGYVLTAAHCVPWSGEGEMALGDRFLVTIIAADGSRLKGQVLAVEPVSDIAVIASPDGQDLPTEADAFSKFVDSTEALILCKDEFLFGEGFPIRIFTHEEQWISGKASQWRENAPTLFLETTPTVSGGTSGSAVVNDRGEVVGVVSTASDSDDGSNDNANDGTCARPCQSLSVWLWQAIKAAEVGDEEAESS
jgi:S1-C subfamily serine protease